MAQDKMLKFLVEGLTRAFDKQEDCDVMFSVDGQTIGAHRLILNIHSQVLYEMAAGWTPDKDPIAIDDMSFDSFKALLRFMYGSEILLSNDTVFIYLSAATHFKMNFLEELSIDHISKSMGIENVCHYMNEAINFKSTMLQEKCQERFSKKTAQISRHESFKKLSQPALSALLDVDETNELEIILFLDVKLWMEQQCRDKGLPVNGTSMRYFIQDALYKIRFPTMTVQDFANSVTTIKGLLTKEEIAEVFQKIAVFANEEVECGFSEKFRCKSNIYYAPFSDMKKLLEEKCVYNNLAKDHCDCSTALKFVKDQKDGKDICTSALSLRVVLQCCADLANTTALTYCTNSENQVTRDELYDELLAWQDIAKTENVSEIMSKYSEMRTKLGKLYRWSL